jgi:hypothetical protein
MSSGSWVNNDGVPLNFGTLKTIPDQGGDYISYGSNRLFECRINLANLITANATIVSQTAIFPAMANFSVEKVELFAEVAMSTSSSPTLSIGVCNANLTGGSSTVTYGTYTTYSNSTTGAFQYEYTGASGYSAATTAGTAITTATIPTNGGTAFVNALAASSLAAGDLVTLTTGSTGVGSYVPDFQDVTNLTSPMFLTATLGTHTATGVIVARIYYHGVGVITN